MQYFTQICSFVEYRFRDQTYFLMNVEYWRPRAPSGPLREEHGIVFFDKRYHYARSRDTLIPVQRIYARYSVISDDIAIELNRKLRL